MVYLFYDDMPLILRSLQSGKRMPLLCAVNHSFGWRAISESYEKHERGMRSDLYDINCTGDCFENYLTCMSISETTGITAIGSGAKNGNLYFVKDMSAIHDIASGPRFKHIHKEQLDEPIHSLDWSGDHLLIGTRHGVCRLYNVLFEDDTLKSFALLGHYINSPSEINLYASSYIANTHVKSVEFAPSYSSDKACLDKQNQFLSTTINVLSIWDASREKAPVNRIEASQSPLNCASWSPNDPQSLAVCGGYERKLLIIDTRVGANESSIVWSADGAHDRPIRDAKFNPFIPYWLASAGEDSITNIWDIRASSHAPVAKIDGYAGVVTSVAWSNIRPENIATTTSDGTMCHWALVPEIFPVWDTYYRIGRYNHRDTLPIVRERDHSNIWFTKDQNYKYKNAKPWKTDVWDEGKEPRENRSAMLLSGALGLGKWGRPEPSTMYKGEKLGQVKGAVISVKASKSRPCVYYSITNEGQFAAHTVRFDTANNLRNRHRFDPKNKDKLAVEIEDDIYCRHITEAYRKLDILKSTICDDQQAKDRRVEEEVSFLEDCLKIHEPITGSSWSFDSIPNMSDAGLPQPWKEEEDSWERAVNNFKSDLKYWSYRIPPGYNKQYKFPLDFEGPIIAPHLIEEVTFATQLLPLPNEVSPSLSDGGFLKQSFYDDSFSSSTIKEQAAGEPTTQSNIDITATPSFYTRRQQSISYRRNIPNVPSIVTANYENLNTKKQSPNYSYQMTPPNSAPVIHCFDQEHTSNNNPFENNITNQSPIYSPESINPFIESNPTYSTNPFMDPANKTVDRHRPSRTSTTPISSVNSMGGDSPRPFRSTTTPISTVSSMGSVQDTESSKSSKSAHKRLSNPFKKIISRHHNKDEDEEERSRKDIHSVSGLMRKVSTRRNALHGHF